MAASGRVTIAQDGAQGNVKLHPYLAALVRWCISSIWTTATVLLHRLMTAPLPPITGPKPTKPRPASSDHLHPEPLVECVVLHEPQIHTLDVIFVHGLYGSLGNTWRQGEWRENYKTDPIKVPLRRPDALPTACACAWDKDERIIDKCECDFLNDSDTSRAQVENRKEIENDKLYENYSQVISDDDMFITEKFYNNTLLDQVEIVGNFETQASFVRELFEKSCEVDGQVDDVSTEVDCKCRNVKCEAGCGCTCNACYSPCWPKDWIKVDFPGARVISINYTSDPYLWRPLWIKESKRQRLHERAEQMMKQLLGLEVGDKPIVWVGHSKGGLFIKQMYCEAYEAYSKIYKNEVNNESNVDKYPKTSDTDIDEVNDTNKDTNINVNRIIDTYVKRGTNENIDTDGNRGTSENIDTDGNIDAGENIDTDQKIGTGENIDTDGNIDTDVINNNVLIPDSVSSEAKLSDLINYVFGGQNRKPNAGIEDNNGQRSEQDDEDTSDDGEMSSNVEEDPEKMRRQANLWKNSAGFMFYSVPHRGSPLADIKTPITARSIELLEICKECSLVMKLQDRWMQATSSAQPAVSSLVETCKTLMSLLWLRIVSVDSADPGIGALSGVSVDHREICKPSSRKCLLYRELKLLIQNALSKSVH